MVIKSFVIGETYDDARDVAWQGFAAAVCAAM
jgi:hypothetical protein